MLWLGLSAVHVADSDRREGSSAQGNWAAAALVADPSRPALAVGVGIVAVGRNPAEVVQGHQALRAHRDTTERLAEGIVADTAVVVLAGRAEYSAMWRRDLALLVERNTAEPVGAA